ncbi:hypothetical protein BC936DRAFT_140680 [Jimgerdemannia flammicorona]|uniref:Uncharacterized protein n=2 Tax=Jimgerdemannia flammicorona TaxID=994334 RepID=A0A433QVE6_9FUNG|nr:hypothetical protein BC936DRAFT_140680 [Jimgerdemannia flammicorona]RUS33791.1 hypothetical protein BC938DRAFT_483925 [Jimgerdemannia flammicorona]
MVAYTYSRSISSQAGWLQKEATSGFRKSFHKRWFVLKGSELKYYKTEEDPIPHGVIDLNDYSTVAHETCKKSPFAFVLKPRAPKEHRAYMLFADSQEEMNLWIKALQSRLGDRSVLDKWLERLDLSSPSFESTRNKSSVVSPTNSTFSKTSSEMQRTLRSHKSNSSLSSNDSLSSAASSAYSGSTVMDSDSEPQYKEKARQQLKDKMTRTTSMPPISRQPFTDPHMSAISSAPTSPTFDNIATRRNVNLPPLPISSIMFTMESNPTPLFLQTPPKGEKWETERARKRRSNSVPRFDCLKTGCITPTFGNTAF